LQRTLHTVLVPQPATQTATNTYDTKLQLTVK